MILNESTVVDPILDYRGLLLVARLFDKRSFSAKLIDVRGNGDQAELWFVARDGRRFMVQRSQVVEIRLARNQASRQVV